MSEWDAFPVVSPSPAAPTPTPSPSPVSAAPAPRVPSWDDFPEVDAPAPPKLPRIAAPAAADSLDAFPEIKPPKVEPPKVASEWDAFPLVPDEPRLTSPPVPPLVPTVPAKTLADIDRTPGLNEAGKAALMQRDTVLAPAPMPPAPVAVPPAPVMSPVPAPYQPERATMERLAVQWGMDPQQARTAVLTPKGMMHKYLAAVPVMPAGTDEEQNAAAIARSAWVKANPVPDIFRNDPDEARRAWFFQQLRAKSPHVPPRTTWIEEAGQVAGRLAAGAARTSAGIVDSLAGLQMAEPNLMGFETAATVQARETDHKAFNEQQKQEARKVAGSIREYAKDKESKLLEPGTLAAKAIATGAEVTGAVAPAIGFGALGGPALGATTAATMAAGSVREAVYTSLVEKGYPDEEAHRLADMAGAGAGAVGLATGNLLGRAPVAKSVAGKIAEQTAEGVAYGGLQAAAEEKLKAAATGDKPDWMRVPTDASVGGAISFGLSALGTLLSRGKAKVRPEVRTSFEKAIAEAKAPADVQKALDDADAVTRAMEEVIDADDATPPASMPKPGSPPPPAPDASPPANTTPPASVRHTADSLKSLSGKRLIETAREMGVTPGARSKTEAAILAEQAKRRQAPAAPVEQKPAGDFRPVWEPGKGYTAEAFDVLVPEGLANTTESGTVTGKSGKRYDVQVGEDELGRPTIKAYREVQQQAASEGQAPAPARPAPDADESLARDRRIVEEENAQVERMQAEHRRREEQDRLYQQELATLRQADERDAAAELERYEIKQEDMAVANEQRRRASLPTYTAEQLARMPKDQLRRVAADAGVTYDAPGTTTPRVLDAQRRRELEALDNKTLYRQVKDLGFKASNRAANIETLLGRSPDQSTPTPAEAPPVAQEPRQATAVAEDAEAPARPQEPTQAPPTAREQPAPARPPAVAPDGVDAARADDVLGIERVDFDAGANTAAPPVRPGGADQVLPPARDARTPQPPQTLDAGASPARAPGQPAQATPASPPAAEVTFTTEKGSTYTVRGRGTQRDKSPHAGHDPADVGVKKPSDLTVYVSPDLANEVGMWNTLSNGGKRVAIRDGKLVLMSRNPKTGKTGRDRVYADAAFSTEPRVGLHPVELWGKGEAGQVYRSNHPGSRIVSMGDAVRPQPDAAPVADLSRPDTPRPIVSSPLPPATEPAMKRAAAFEAGLDSTFTYSDGGYDAPDGVRVAIDARGRDLRTGQFFKDPTKAADLWYVENIASKAKGKGNASRALQTITQLADEHGVTLRLLPRKPASEKRGLSDAALTEWYKRHGFEPREGLHGFMERRPQQAMTPPRQFSPTHRDAIGRDVEYVRDAPGGMVARYADAAERKLEPGDVSRMPQSPSLEPPAAARPDFGSTNKVFTRDSFEQAKARLKAKLSQANTGVDPEMVTLATQVAGFYVEGGARRFADFAREAVAEFGEAIRPYLRMAFNAVRDYPGMDDVARQMDDYATVRAFDLDSIPARTLESPQAGDAGTIPNQQATHAADRPVQPDAVPDHAAGTVRDERPGVLRPDTDEAGQPADGPVGADGARSLAQAPAGAVRGPRQVEVRDAGGDTGAGGRQGHVRPAGRAGDGRPGRAGDRVEGVRPARPARAGDGAGPRGGGEQPARGVQQLPGEPEPTAADTPASAANYLIRDAATLHAGGAKTKFRANVDAIALMRRIEAEGRPATPSEQEVLAKYTGWGAMPGAFNKHGDAGAWATERDEIRGLLTDDEWNAAAKSTLNAHYTAGPVVEGMWDIARRLGFDGGRMLEPSMGVGNFFGLVPPDLRNSTRLTGVELDPLTGRIARLLYPRANVQVKGFEALKTPNGFFDLTMSNFPFGDYRVHDPAYDKHRANIHDYFFLKSLDKTRPGGLVIGITSTGTMDKMNPAIRQAMAEKADLVAAIRLPGGAFKENAGTDVVTDIVILKRRAPGQAAGGEAFEKVVGVPDPDGGATIPLNEYFRAHPANILGRLDRTGTMYGGNQVNVSMTGDVAGMLREAIQRLPEGIFERAGTRATEAPPAEAFAPDKAKAGAYVVQRGPGGKPTVQRNVNGVLTAVEMEPRQRAIVADSIGVRDAMRELVHAQINQAGEGAKNAGRRKLAQVYDAFVKKHGPLNRQQNARAFADDPDAPNLLALEKWDAATRTAEKADIFFKDTVRGYERPTKAADPGEALGISLNETGRVNVARLSELLGTDEATVGRRLAESGLAYENPAGGWESAEQYLSGNVRRKLVEAREAAQADARYAPNVAALEKVQPADVSYDEIDVRLGAPWVPATDVVRFAAETFGGDDGHFDVKYIAATGEWLADYTSAGDRRWMGSPQNTQLFGTSRAPFPDVFEAALNNRTITIRDRIDKDTTVVNHKESADANAKVQELKERFREWVWQDDERRGRLHRYYNDTFNALRPVQYDGRHLTFPGMNPGIRLNDHQRNAVWRTVSTGTGLYAHEVGTGKTYTMAAAAMELRRLGLARKPAIVALKATMETVVKQARELYPNARVLAVENFDAANRKKTVARIATGDWDMVVLSHDNVDMLPMSVEAQAAFIQREIDELASVIATVEDASGGRGKGGKQGNRLVKRLEKAKARLEERLRDALAGRKDDVVTFEETGIDQLFVDEAHKYKSLPVYTKQDRIKGVPTSRSDRATAMWMRAQWLQDQHNGRGVVFATGTPVTNTMAELYTMQRYLQMQDLRDRGVAAFDAWAATFGNVTTTMEYTVTGEYKPVSRFAEFVNLPELTQLARTVFDVKRAADIPDFKRPKREDAVAAVPMSDGQRAYMADIQRRAEAAKKKRPGEPGDNMLSISTDARKSAIDLRMVDPHAEFDPAGKVAAVVRNVLRLHRENPGATQMLFSDIGVNPTPWGFSLYQDVIDRLVAGGIPRDKIINFGTLTDAKKKKAAARLNDGDALVAIGSTDKLGTGVNAQQYLKALHHLDVPWLPGYLEQRDGRAWRQKNTHERISIHRYVTEGSFDTFMWQTVDKKTRFIRQATDGKDVGRVVKDEDAEELTPAQVMAIASGNPLLLEKVQVDKDFTDLQAAARRHERNELQMRDRTAEIDRQIKRRTAEVEAVEKDLALARASADADFSIEIDGRTYTDREKAAEAMEVFKAQHYSTPRPVPMGRLKGFDLLFGRATQGGEIYVRGAFESMGTPTLPSVEVRTRPAFFENAATRGREMLGNLTKDLSTLRGQVGKPFSKAAELDRVGQRRAEIETRLVAQGQQQAAASTPDTGYNPAREASDGPTAKTAAEAADAAGVLQLPARNADRESPTVSVVARGGADDAPATRADVGQAIRAHVAHHSRVTDTPDGWQIDHPDGSTTQVRYATTAGYSHDANFAASLVAKMGGEPATFDDGVTVHIPTTAAELLGDTAKLRLLKQRATIHAYVDISGDLIIDPGIPRYRVESAVAEEVYHRGFNRLSDAERQAVYDHVRQVEGRNASEAEAEELAFGLLYQRLGNEPFAAEPPAFEAIRRIKRGDVFGAGGSRPPTTPRPSVQRPAVEPITGARVKARGDEIVQEAKDAGTPMSLAAARKQAYQEIQDQSSRNPMRPRGAVDIGALEGPVKAATLPLRGAKKLLDAWSRSLIDTVESQGGAVGKRIAQGMRRANDDARDIVGSLHPTLNRYSDAVSGAPGRNFLARRRAVQELQEPILSDGYGYSRLQLATEGKIPLDDLSPEARQIVQLRRDLTAEIGQHAVKRGVMVVDEKMARADRKAARQASAAAKAAKRAWQKPKARRRKNDPDVEADGAQWRGLRDTFGKDHPAVALARRQWRQRWAERVDNDPAVRDAFTAWQERREAARQAREKAAAKGVRPFIPARDGMRWVRSYSPEFYEIADLADDNGLKMALANAIADANGIDAKVAMRHVNETARPLVKHNATETVRLLKDFPGWVQHPTTGRWIEVLNIDPLTSGRALVDNAALRLGYISVFGQDIAGRTPSAALVDAFSKAGGNREDLERAIRAMNGVPEDRVKLPGIMRIEPGTAEHDAIRAVGSVYHVLKSGALTTAAVPNALEPFTKTLAFAGVGPWLRGLAAVARHPFASREMTAAIGARTVDRMRWMTRPGHRAEDVMQAVGNVLTAPLKLVNEWNELHAARTGMELAKDIRAGKHKGAAAVTLEVLGFSPSQVERMVSGRGSDAEYGAIATRFAEKTQGTTSNPAEKSIAANSRLWRLAVPFDSWAQMTANRTALVVTTWGRAVRSGDPPRIAQATKLLATHFFGHAAAGAGAAFLYAWLNGGEAGVEIKKAEAKDDPVQFAKDALLNGMLGGVAGRLYRAIESPRSNKWVEIPQSASYPATLLQDAVEAFNGWGRYRDQEAGDRATAFLRNRFAINRGVANLMAAWGITADDPAREVAISAFYRWRWEQADLPQQRGGERLTAEDRVPFRRKMRQTLEAMKRLDEPAAQKALAEALNLDDEKSVAASIRGRKLMNGLEDDHKAKLRKRVGDAAYQKLESHDDLLESWAQSLRFETETNRGVHARHGDKLLAFDKERDAVEKAYEPIKKRLTGLWMEDVDLLNANADLIDRRKELAAKARELEKIRKSLKKHPKTPFTHLGMTDAELNKEMDRVLSE